MVIKIKINDKITENNCYALHAQSNPIFDDSSLANQIKYIKERKLINPQHYVLIQLSELSEDYYKYLKFFEQEQPDNIPPTNITGGYGIFGAMNNSDIIEFLTISI